MVFKLLNIMILIVGLLIIAVGTGALIYGQYLAVFSYFIGGYFVNEYRNNLNYF